MLVIARKVGQTILIGEEIEITVSAVRGDQVRLAIQAPRTLSILRKETVEQVELDNVAAIVSAAESLELHPPAPIPLPQQDSNGVPSKGSARSGG
jgi:carbon storage regulator